MLMLYFCKKWRKSVLFYLANFCVIFFYVFVSDHESYLCISNSKQAKQSFFLFAGGIVISANENQIETKKLIERDALTASHEYNEAVVNKTEKEVEETANEKNKKSFPAQWLENFTEEELQQSQNEADKYREQVKQATMHSWNGYEKHAFGFDNLKPLFGKSEQSYGLSVTLIDSLDTLWLMGLKDQFEKAAKFVEDEFIKLDNCIGSQSFFEITIRVLGGLISAYQLSERKGLFDVLKIIGERYLMIFERSKSILPRKSINLCTLNFDYENAPNLAEAGSFMLEFRELSFILKNKKYMDIADNAVNYIQTLSHNLYEGYRYLPHSELTDNEGYRYIPHSELTNNALRITNWTISMGGRSDSYFEYLLKLYFLTDETEEDFRSLWNGAMDEMVSLLVRKTKGSKKYTFLDRVKLLEDDVYTQRYYSLPPIEIMSETLINNLNPDDLKIFVNCFEDATLKDLIAQKYDDIGINRMYTFFYMQDLKNKLIVNNKNIENCNIDTTTSNSARNNVTFKGIELPSAMQNNQIKSKHFIEIASEIFNEIKIAQEEYYKKNEKKYGEKNLWYENKMEHLDCFVPGMLILSSKFKNKKYVNNKFIKLAHELIETCVNFYFTTPTGLSRDVTYLNTTKGATNEIVTSNNEELTNLKYILRPETVESLYYMHYFTGDPKYRQWGYKIFDAIKTHCRTDYGYATKRNVLQTKKNSYSLIDEMESFWIGETLKYLFLLFSDQSVLSLDNFVFTTEAHLLKIQKNGLPDEWEKKHFVNPINLEPIQFYP